MKNIKKISLYSVLTFSVLKISCIGDDFAKKAVRAASAAAVEAAQIASTAHLEAVKTLSGAGLEMAQLASTSHLEAVKTLSGAGLEMAQQVGVESTRIAANAGIEATKIAADASIEVSKTAAQGAQGFGVEAVKELTPYFGAALCILALKEVAYAGADLYAYNNPDKEKLARIRVAEETIDFIDSKRNFRSCLMKDPNVQRNKDGIPTTCEELGKMYSNFAGRAAFRDMVETFKETYQE